MFEINANATKNNLSDLTTKEIETHSTKSKKLLDMLNTMNESHAEHLSAIGTALFCMSMTEDDVMSEIYVKQKSASLAELMYFIEQLKLIAEE